MFVIKRQRPEAIDRWSLILGESHGVAVCAVEPGTGRVEVLVVVFRLVWRIDEDVRFSHCSAREVVGAEGGLVRYCAPIMRKLFAVVAELEDRRDSPVFSRLSRLDPRRF